MCQHYRSRDDTYAQRFDRLRSDCYTCFAIKVPIGFRKVEVSKTSQLGVITANQLNKQGIKEFQLDAEK